MQASKTVAFVATVVLLLAAGGTARAQITIETVPVGNPGNPDDIHGDGYGGVDYIFNIGKYEVTNAQYCEFLNAGDPSGDNVLHLYASGMEHDYGGITRTPGNPMGAKYEVLPGRGNKPVNYVNFWDACRFANWLHNGQGDGDTETGAYTLTSDGIASNTITRNSGWKWAVPSEDEWYKAAYYAGASGVYHDYATGTDVGAYPTAEAPPGTNMVKGSANYNGAVGDLTDVGAYTGKPSDSPYGTFDQNGNVFEWNDTILYWSFRGLRGGDLAINETQLRAVYRHGSPDPTWERYFIGFRVVQVPEPVSAALLAVGALVLGRRRLRRQTAHRAGVGCP